MPNIAEWVKLLATFGPFGLIVFIGFILEPRARSQMKDIGLHSKAVSIAIYAATWTAVFVMCGFAVWVWIKLNIPQTEASIHGHLSGLQITDQIRSPQRELYVHRTDDRVESDITWRLISDKPLVGQTIDIYIDRSTASKEDTWKYSFPVISEYYGLPEELAMAYDRKGRDLTLTNSRGTKKLPISSATPLSINKGANQFWGPIAAFLSPVVFAQSSGPLDGMVTRLESNDVLVRLSARSDLVRAGAQGIAFIQETLSAQDSSYRMRVGTISALNKFSGLQATSLNFPANCSIVRAATDSDPTLRSEAYSYLASHPGLPTAKSCGLGVEPSCPDSINFRLGSGEINKVDFDEKPYYVFLKSVSIHYGGKDTASIYIISSEKVQWPRKRLSDKIFLDAIKGLHEVTDSMIGDEAYRVLVLDSTGSEKIRTASGHNLRITLKPNGAMRRADFALCRG